MYNFIDGFKINCLTVLFSGNPFPPLLQQRSDQRNFIHNVLLDEAKKAYRAQKYEEITKSLGEQQEIEVPDK